MGDVAPLDATGQRDRYQQFATAARELLTADAAQLAGDGLTVVGSRPVGAVHLLDGLWRALEIDTALRKVLGPRRFTTNVERVRYVICHNPEQAERDRTGL